jgi:hypothetical protein
MTDQMAVLEQVVVGGDLSKLSAADRMLYYRSVCESVGLNPLTRPLEFLTLSGRLVLYARKDATDQLRKKHGVSITKVDDKVIEGIYIVTAYAKDSTGREDSEIGAVPIDGLKGEFRANAMMKAQTKAKRRVTLSICGLGMLDETEVDSIPGAQPIAVDPQTGELPPAPHPTEGDVDRDILLAEIKSTADQMGLKGPKRAELWSRYCSGDPRTVDVSTLHDLLAALRMMRDEGKKPA